MDAKRTLWARIAAVHPSVYALGVVASSTWIIATTLFIAMIRNINYRLDQEALDGTAFTLLSSMVALWAGFGAWAGRHRSRRVYLVVSLVALAGIVLITGMAMLYLALAGEPFAIPSNVAQLLILTTTALVSIAGASVGYKPDKTSPELPDDEV